MNKLTRTYLAVVGGIILLGGLVLFLALVFSGTIVLPQGLRLGPVSIRYYGIILALAIVASYWLARRRAGEFGLSVSKAESTLFYIIIAGFIGARLYHVASDWDFYQGNLGQIIAVWRGGLSIFGAILGGIAYIIWSAKQAGLSFWRILDWLVPSVIIGQILGRFGNLFNYEAYGYPTSLPWKMSVPLEFRPNTYFNSQFFHPLFLYEVVANTIILIVVWLFRKRLSPGALFFGWLFLYNMVRFSLEFLRIDSVFIGSVRLNTISSAVLGLIGLGGFIILHVRKHSQNS